MVSKYWSFQFYWVSVLFEFWYFLFDLFCFYYTLFVNLLDFYTKIPWFLIELLMFEKWFWNCLGFYFKCSFDWYFYKNPLNCQISFYHYHYLYYCVDFVTKVFHWRMCDLSLFFNFTIHMTNFYFLFEYFAKSNCWVCFFLGHFLSLLVSFTKKQYYSVK